MEYRRLRLAAGLAAFTAACGGQDLVGNSSLQTGTYRAEVFFVTPTGQAQIDVLGAGGSLSITINSDGTTSGSLSVPASVTGGAPLTASMAGTAEVNAFTVSFDQNADTFVRDLTWTRVGTSIQVANQVAGDAAFTISLFRD